MKTNKHFNIISITGKSGSGKTYVARMLASRLCAELVPFDEISHKTLEQFDILNNIKRVFGNDVFDGNILNRKKLGEKAFNDSKKLDFLNKMCQMKMEELIDLKLKNNKDTLFIFEYALLPKMKYFKISKCKILIKADAQIRKSRILSRDKISEEYFDARESNSLEYNEADFDIVIENNEHIDFEVILKKIKEILCSEKR